jgi:hypothetical protein
LSASSAQKVDSDDSIAASQQDAADFIDSIGQVQTRKEMRAPRHLSEFRSLL